MCNHRLRIIVCLAVCISVFAITGICSAVDISGFWKGQMGDDKKMGPVELMLSQTGKDLKGTLTMHTNDGDIDFSLIGLIDGNTYSLKSTSTQLAGGLGSARISFKGTADVMQIIGSGYMTMDLMMGMGSQTSPLKISLFKDRN